MSDELRHWTGVNLVSDDSRLQEAVESGDSELVQSLIASGVNLNQANWEEGITPLEIAASLGETEIVQLLLEAGLHPDLGITCSPLEHSVREGYMEITDALIKFGADVNQRLDEGFTPIMVASARGRLELVRLLVEAGANVNLCSDFEDFPLKIATSNGNREVAEYLLPLTNPKLRAKAS